MGVNRRSFIKYASLAAAGNAAALRPFGALSALAQNPTDYKALVCVFLYGGNDANNTLIQFDTAGYNNYSTVRGPLAIPQNQLLQLSGSLAPNTFALNPNRPDIQTLFNNKNAAIVANVGTLMEPTTAAQFKAGVDLPTNLFSHPDQQLEWQNVSQSGATQTGWAGRIADQLNTSYNPNGLVPMITSVAGDTLFCNGNGSTPVSVSPGNLTGAQCSEGTTECAAQQATAQALLTFSSGLTLVQADNNITSNAYNYAKVLTAATQSVLPLQSLALFPKNGLGAQQIIQVQAALGVNRQIFFCGIGNFDTHSDQLVLQNALLAGISPALNAFYQATVEMKVQNSVTAFTMSDFSRTFQPNSNTGSDHAWGSHHIVIGGAVKGGQMYGTFPTLHLAGPDDSGANGRWVPSTGSVQYAAQLASWFGVSTAQMPAIFPTLSSFTNPNPNLSFI
jgi:uncharacterized protein (DUF1501 family)